MGPYLSWTVNLNCPKEDNKISFYTKNQHNFMNFFKLISSNIGFGPKNGQIWTEREEPDFSGNLTELFHK